MLEFTIIPKMYIQDGDLVIELIDGDGFYISDCVIPLIELKEALDELAASTAPSMVSDN